MIQSKITIPYAPVGRQWEYYRLNTRFTIGRIGRQWGKTTLALLRLTIKALKKPGVYWWVSPTIGQAKIPFRRYQKDFHSMIKSVNKTDMTIELISSSLIFFKGSDDPMNLKGETLDGGVLDEFATMRSEVWPEVIRPMLSVKNGWADFIGTPKGKNHFYELENQAKLLPGVWSMVHLSSNTSPFFSQAEYLDAKQNTSERIFRQEYDAEYIDSGGEVFRDFKSCINGTFENPREESSYVMGVDLAKTVDFTVITIWDTERKHMVYFDRFNQLNWSYQENSIVAAAQRYNNAHVYVDATGVGDPIYERLRSRGLHITPVKFNQSVKEQLIESLVFSMEKREITFPHHPDIVSELSVFSAEKTLNGIRYSAPPGYHDDIVISMSLAVKNLTRRHVKFKEL